MRGGASKTCYNCDQPNFTPEHLTRCLARSATCYFCQKTGHYEKIFRGKRTNRGGPAVGLIQSQEDVDVSEIGDAEDAYSQYENSVGWVNTPDSAKNTGGKDDVSSRRTTGARNNKRGGFI